MEKAVDEIEIVEQDNVLAHDTVPEGVTGTPVTLPHELCLEIFRYATFRPSSRDITPSDSFKPRTVSRDAMRLNTMAMAMQMKSTIVLVCHLWRAIATELLYEHITICSPWRAHKVLTAIQLSRGETPAHGDHDSNAKLQFSHNSHGQWARRLDICANTRVPSYLLFLQDIFQILCHCPNLIALSLSFPHGIPEGFQAAVSHLFGQSLHGLAWDGRILTESNMCSNRTFVSSFQSLHILDVRSVSASLLGADGGNNILPCVRELLVSNELSSLEFAGALQLPALRRVVFSRSEKLREYSYVHSLESFLRVHGPRIVDLEITLPPCHCNLPVFHISHFLGPEGCPNLEQLVFHSQERAVVNISVPHQNLRRIGMRGVGIDKLSESDNWEQHGVRAHLKTFNHEHFPCLEVIRTVEFLVASSVDDVSIDVFIAWTEYFEKMGIDFQDGEGVVWLYEGPDPYSKGPRYIRE